MVSTILNFVIQLRRVEPTPTITAFIFHYLVCYILSETTMQRFGDKYEIFRYVFNVSFGQTDMILASLSTATYTTLCVLHAAT